MTIIDEYTRECLAIEVARRLDADAVQYRLAELFVERRPPDYIRSDNGPEFTAKAVREWLGRIGVKTLYIEPGRWRREYNTFRPHSALGYRPPAPETIEVIPRDPGYATLRQNLWLDMPPNLT